jgi:hypothetical protein
MTPGETPRNSYFEPPAIEHSQQQPPRTKSEFLKKLWNEPIENASTTPAGKSVLPLKPSQVCDPSERFCDYACTCLGCSKSNCCSRYTYKKGIQLGLEKAIDDQLDDAFNKAKKSVENSPAPINKAASGIDALLSPKKQPEAQSPPPHFIQLPFHAQIQLPPLQNVNEGDGGMVMLDEPVAAPVKNDKGPGPDDVEMNNK